MQKRPNIKRGPVDLQDIRRVVFILSVTSTLGFWAYFSRANPNASANANSTTQVAGSTPPVQANNQAVLELPPMPTLIPLLNASPASVNAVPAAPANSVISSSPAGLKPGKILLGGSKPASSSPVVTRTRSSR